MEKGKKLQLITSLALLNTFASPIWANVTDEFQHKIQMTSLEPLDAKNTPDAAKNPVKIRSKHLAKLNKRNTNTAYSTTHTSSTHY